MTRAEEASIAYQLVAHGPRVMGGTAVLSEDDYKFWNINYDFKAGYEQAEKDLGLTWEDVQLLDFYAMECQVEESKGRKFNSSQEFFEEVLRRFNKAKEEKK